MNPRVSRAMSVFQGLLLSLLIMFLASCAQKLPDSGFEHGGLAALPTRAVMAAPFGSFVYYYVFSGTSPTPFELKIYPKIGQDFSLSDIYPPGEYVIDTLTLYGSPSMNSIPEVYKRGERLHEKFTVEIVKGGVTMVDLLFEVTLREVDHERFTTTREWRRLEKDEWKLWRSKLQAMDHSGSWEISVE